MGLKGRVIGFLKGYLSNWIFQVIIGNNRSKVFREETGVPQGSVIVVTLFLVAMDGFFADLSTGILLFVYADDIVLMAVQATTKALRRKLKSAVSHATKSAGFQLSAPKSGFMHCCRIQHPVINSPITVKDGTIPRKKTLKILGVIIDRNISFIQHFNNVKDNCKLRIKPIGQSKNKIADWKSDSKLRADVWTGVDVGDYGQPRKQINTCISKAY